MSSKIYQAIVAGFIGGFLSVLVFHQLFIWAMMQAGWMNANVYSARAIPPLGVPQILSQAFWGGLWGIVFALVVPRLASPFDGIWGGLTFRVDCAHAGCLVRRGAAEGPGSRQWLSHAGPRADAPHPGRVRFRRVMVFIAQIFKLFNWKWS